MERNIRSKVNKYIENFKENIEGWLSKNNAHITICNQDNQENDTDQIYKNSVVDFIQYINDYPPIEITKDDFKKRRRIKNTVPDYNKCIALKCNGERCSRKHKNNDTLFCGTHMKGAPYGTIEQESQIPKKVKVNLWLEDINGISRYIDNNFNVYSSEDIINLKENPRVIGKCCVNANTGMYQLL